MRILHKIHASAGFIALSLVSTFWASTATVELFGSANSIYMVKKSILFGMIGLIPSMIVTGITGNRLSLNREHTENSTVIVKKKRMMVAALNGMFILLPSAIFLEKIALNGEFNTAFYIVQCIELAGGMMNIILLSKNMCDGFRLRSQVGENCCGFLNRNGGSPGFGGSNDSSEESKLLNPGNGKSLTIDHY